MLCRVQHSTVRFPHEPRDLLAQRGLYATPSVARKPVAFTSNAVARISTLKSRQHYHTKKCYSELVLLWRKIGSLRSIRGLQCTRRTDLMKPLEIRPQSDASSSLHKSSSTGSLCTTAVRLRGGPNGQKHNIRLDRQATSSKEMTCSTLRLW